MRSSRRSISLGSPAFALTVVSSLVCFAASAATASDTALRVREDLGARPIYASDGETLVDLLPKQVMETRTAGQTLRPALELPDAIAPAPVRAHPGATAVSRDGFVWILQLETLAVFTDLSMASATHGFASAELGKVYRTTDGSSWTQVLNLGFPRYWYGVHAFDENTAFITGFQNQTGEGIARWTYNGGATWTADVVIDPDDWLTITRFADSDHGIATNIGGGVTHVTTNGGAQAGDWNDVQADPGGGWFAGNFTFMPDNLFVYLTGISFCRSRDGGLSYSCRSSIDPVFDGGVSFPDTTHGWTGGGQISAPVQGWVHRTTNAGASWSGRILNPAYPIRSLLFFDAALGFAVGGNYFQSVGGIWSTTDGGDSWNLDVDTGVEMKGIDWARVSPDSVDVWCAGARSGAVGRIYRTRLYLPETSTTIAASTPVATTGQLTAHPNPFNPRVTLSFTASTADHTTLKIIDITGRHVRTLIDGPQQPGEHQVTWNGHDDADRPLPSGVYIATVTSATQSSTHRLVLLR